MMSPTQFLPCHLEVILMLLRSDSGSFLRSLHRQFALVLLLPFYTSMCNGLSCDAS